MGVHGAETHVTDAALHRASLPELHNTLGGSASVTGRALLLHVVSLGGRRVFASSRGSGAPVCHARAEVREGSRRAVVVEGDGGLEAFSLSFLLSTPSIGGRRRGRPLKESGGGGRAGGGTDLRPGRTTRWTLGGGGMSGRELEEEEEKLLRWRGRK